MGMMQELAWLFCFTTSLSNVTRRVRIYMYMYPLSKTAFGETSNYRWFTGADVEKPRSMILHNAYVMQWLHCGFAKCRVHISPWRMCIGRAHITRHRSRGIRLDVSMRQRQNHLAMFSTCSYLKARLYVDAWHIRYYQIKFSPKEYRREFY